MATVSLSPSRPSSRKSIAAHQEMFSLLCITPELTFDRFISAVFASQSLLPTCASNAVGTQRVTMTTDSAAADNDPAS